jgi:hypothetical protein
MLKGCCGTPISRHFILLYNFHCLLGWLAIVNGCQRSGLAANAWRKPTMTWGPARVWDLVLIDFGTGMGLPCRSEQPHLNHSAEGQNAFHTESCMEVTTYQGSGIYGVNGCGWKLIETGLNPQRRVSPNDISYLSNDPIHVESWKASRDMASKVKRKQITSCYDKNISK